MASNSGNFKDLVIWNQGMDLCENVYSLIKKFPHEEMFALGTQLRRSVVSIPSNIAEGHDKGSTKEFIQGLYTARGSNAEVQTQIILSHRFGYISKVECDRAVEELIYNSRSISGLIKYLKTVSNYKD